jgi:hypothetical protein
MKVFISWSGDKSKQVALLLEEWIKMVIQASQPWVSTNIESGSLWFQEINEQLKEVSLGIVCITAENKEKPWILFEAGALAKGLNTNRVCTLLIDLKNEDVGQPLAQFNHSYPSKEGIYKLLTTINTQLGQQALPQHILEKVFNKNWDDFEERFEIISAMPSPEITQNTQRQSDDILREVLNTVRGFDKRMQRLEQGNPFSEGITQMDKWVQELDELELTRKELESRIERATDDKEKMRLDMLLAKAEARIGSIQRKLYP